MSLATATNINDKNYMARISIDLGNVYRMISNYEKSLEYNLNALNIHHDLENKYGIAESYLNIATVYYYLVNFDKALDYNNKALTIYKVLNDTTGIAKSLGNIAMVYTNLDSIDKSQQYNFMALELMRKVNNSEGEANSFTNIGIAYLRQGKYEESLKYLNKALDKFDKVAYQRSRTLVIANMGIVYYQLGDYSKALEYADRGYEIAKVSQSVDLLAILYNLYSEIYFKTSDFKKAYDYKQAFTAIRDSIFNVESRNKISELEIKIETEHKVKENALLKQTNRLQLIFFISISILIIIIVFVIFSRYKTKQKANIMLEEKNMKITEQNNSLEILNKELNEANAAKDKFFSIMAHDLKSPLWWFKNVTDLLSHKFDQLSREKIIEITKVLDESAQTSLHLIENLLQWSRSQSGRIEFLPENLTLKSLVTQIINYHNLHAENKSIKIVNEISDDIIIRADKNMLLTILRNLVSNAIKFSLDNSEIKINMEETPESWKIIVLDGGVGIADKDIDNIFRIDVQTTTLGTAQEKGTGLGLIITKEFIQKHGGQLLVESKPNEGSKFSVIIPKN
jgi:signal transduction histidine kinase